MNERDVELDRVAGLGLGYQHSLDYIWAEQIRWIIKNIDWCNSHIRRVNAFYGEQVYQELSLTGLA